MRRVLLSILFLVVAIVLAQSLLYSVDRTEFVYLTQFGRHVQTFDGANDADAGLHVKWPWPVQTVQRFDRRLQYFDLPATESLTRDPERKTIDRTLTIDAYVCWRIHDVDRFVRTVGTPDAAQAFLSQRINSQLGAAIGQMKLDDLVSTEQGRVDRERESLRQRLLNNKSNPLRETARSEYGIDVVDVRLRRSNYPVAVREAIFARIRSEREKKSADYRSEGTRLADDIKSDSVRQVAVMKAEADAKAIRLRGQADADADSIRGQAASQDPQFYSFLKKLEEYQRILGDNKTMLLLSTHREMFDALFQPPGANGTSTGKTPPSAPMPGSKTEEK
jgi:membrane protease subunit HflC